MDAWMNSVEGGEEDPEGGSAQMFSTRRPRDVFAGTASGAKSAGKGLLFGVASLCICPIACGCSAETVPGGACRSLCGLVGGALGAAIFPVCGCTVGVYQFLRGIAYTPGAIYYKCKGQHFDDLERHWVCFDPQRAVVLDPTAANTTTTQPRMSNSASAPNIQAPSSSSSAPAGVSDDVPLLEQDYFQLLGVSRDAAPDQIKRQYYKMARKYHPDKNPDNEDAQAVFQRIGRAYQVLSDPAMRQQYEQVGEEGMQDAQVVDAGVIFDMLFGSSKFQEFVGELASTSMLASAEDSEAATPSMPNVQLQREMKRKEITRIASLAQGLRKKLDEFNAKGDAVVEKECRTTAAQLVSASYGPQMLEAIGRAYRYGANRGNGGWGGFKAMVSESFQGMSLQWGVLQKGIAMMKAQRGAEEGAEEFEAQVVYNARGDIDLEATQRATERAQEQAQMEKTLPQMLEMVWSVNLVDIASTLQTVCKCSLFGGYGVAEPTDRHHRARLAHMLGVMATAFLEVAAEHREQEGEASAQEQLERATFAATVAANAKHSGEDVDVDALFREHVTQAAPASSA
eukprot:m.110376 g.110376  ORF g.110376 m.110376 type:complete len:569 (-) comp13400_c0_seq1:423-2129(-)